MPVAVSSTYGLSQDSETGCPKLAIVEFLGAQIFKGDDNIQMYQKKAWYPYTMQLIQCNGNYMEMKKINYMLEIDIF